MTRDEAVAVAIESKKKWGGGSSELWLVNALEALGVLNLVEPSPPTLWELLRKHGINVVLSQHICNDAMLNGVRIPRDGPADVVGTAPPPK